MRKIKILLKKIITLLLGYKNYFFFREIIDNKKFCSKDFFKKKIIIIGSTNFFDYLTRYKQSQFYHIKKFGIKAIIYCLFVNSNEAIIDKTNFFSSRIKISKNFFFKIFLKLYHKKITLFCEKEDKKLFIKKIVNIKFIEFDDVIDFTINNPHKLIDKNFKDLFFKKRDYLSRILIYNNDLNKELTQKIKNKFSKNLLFIIYDQKANIKKYDIFRYFKNSANLKKNNIDYTLINPNKKNYSENFLNKILTLYFLGKKIILTNKNKIQNKKLRHIVKKFYKKPLFIDDIKLPIKKSINKTDIDDYKEIFENIYKFKTQLNEIVFKKNKTFASFKKNKIVIFVTLNRIKHLYNIKKNLKKIDIKIFKVYFLCHKIPYYENKIKTYFKNLKFRKFFIFDNNPGHGKLINMVLKKLDKDIIWLKLDDDDDYYRGYFEEVLSNIRISNCYYVGKKIGYYKFKKKSNFITISENIFRRSRMNVDHISGASMAGISNITEKLTIPEIQTNKLDVSISRICRENNIDYFIGSGLFVRVNRFNNKYHTWKIKNRFKNLGITKKILDEFY